MNDLNKIAYCGLFCGTCKIFLSTQNDTFDELSLETKIPIDLLNDLKQKGNKEWLEIQKKRWSCNNCGQPYSWYDKKCENCNENIDGLEK